MATFSSLGAAERAAAILDSGSFDVFPEVVPGAPFVAGCGLLDGAPVVVALIDGHVRGGTIGTAEAAILAQVADKALKGHAGGQRPVGLIVGFDTGGVRVEEGPRALAAASAIGVALARLTLLDVPVAAVISGPRGCFGAPSVMAALPERIIMTEGANWGLTGPRLFADLAVDAPPDAGFEATSAERRLANGDAHAVVADAPERVRAELKEFVSRAVGRRAEGGVLGHIEASAATLASMRAALRQAVGTPAPGEPGPSRKHKRDLLRFSCRGQWVHGGVEQRVGLVHAAGGMLGGHPALSLIVGPEGSRGGGVGIEEAAVISDMVCQAARQPAGERAAILSFLFCQGHAVDLDQERFGLSRALAECLRTMVGARLLGHPIVSVLGGGTYGAAYLSIAAPSHRILAMRGTSVAPMAPQVLRAFQALRGAKAGQEAEIQLAELIPEIRIVESVIRLPRVLREELTGLLESVRPGADAA